MYFHWMNLAHHILCALADPHVEYEHIWCAPRLPHVVGQIPLVVQKYMWYLKIAPHVVLQNSGIANK